MSADQTGLMDDLKNDYIFRILEELRNSLIFDCGFFLSDQLDDAHGI